jgi:hypothetical protein
MLSYNPNNQVENDINKLKLEYQSFNPLHGFGILNYLWVFKTDIPFLLKSGLKQQEEQFLSKFSLLN